MLIDCDDCAMLDTAACDDCVVTHLLGSIPVDLSENHQKAIENLSRAGLVPTLKLMATERRVS